MSVDSGKKLKFDRLLSWNTPGIVADARAAPFFGSEDQKLVCSAYMAPPEVIDPVALTTRDMSSIDDTSIERDLVCGNNTAVHHRGWVWLIDRDQGMNDLLMADGLVACDIDGKIVTSFRARRTDHLQLRMVPANKTEVSLSVMNATGPPTGDRKSQTQ